MIQRYTISHLITVTTLAALLFATLQFPHPFPPAVVIIFLWGVFHVMLARRLECYESIFPGVIAALLTGMFIGHISGGGSSGAGWFEMIFYPLSALRWIAMACVGRIVQVKYVHVHCERERAFQHERTA